MFFLTFSLGGFEKTLSAKKSSSLKTPFGFHGGTWCLYKVNRSNSSGILDGPVDIFIAAPEIYCVKNLNKERFFF